MGSESEPLESYYASDTLWGLIRSGWTLLQARRVKPRNEDDRKPIYFTDIGNHALYILLIVFPAIFLEAFQRLRSVITNKKRRHPQGAWQFYLHTGLREDLAHHTNETAGYHKNRPSQATDVDDLTAWVMALIQFLWHYDDLMAAVWDEWVMLQLINEAAAEVDLLYDDRFHRLQRQWEVQRPYNAPLNGTYADVRRAAFEEFITSRLDALPQIQRNQVLEQHNRLARLERDSYVQQMSLLATMQPGKYEDTKEPIELWDARIGLIVCGKYYLLHVVDHDETGVPVVYGHNGRQWKLHFNVENEPTTPIGDALKLENDQFFRKEDGQLVGYIDMAPASRVKYQLRAMLEDCSDHTVPPDDEAVDILLAETPRPAQQELRSRLPVVTRASLQEIKQAPIILNWDLRPSNEMLAETRRAQRGVGDHALTIMRTVDSFIFDQSHVFFDGTWSMAMAEVLTNAATRWCERCITLPPSETFNLKPLDMQTSSEFLDAARKMRQPPEISAETTIWDISNIFSLRKMLKQTGTQLTVNDLLVITRIFHAAHYSPSRAVETLVDELREKADEVKERRAVEAIERSLERGRVINPALLIPVDASPTDPVERIFPITFRNLADNLVWIWDDTWDAYQNYRKHDPTNTPEGRAAFQEFALKRTLLIGNLRAFSFILDANKQVAMRGDSINVAILNLLVGLPPFLQWSLKQIVEQFTVLNEVIRGDEVYSNVGRVVKGSTLTRFMTAKDDGNTKALAWGVMTDDSNRLIVTMRDFRPHVKPLVQAGRIDIAHLMAQNYVETYTADLIGLVARLSAMLQAEAPGKDREPEPAKVTTG